MLLIVVVLLSCFLKAIMPTQFDEIGDLPGLSYTLNFKQYSGYLNTTEGKYLHYWFVESQRSPASDPVVLWLNGGPGCSSIEGLLSELGPFQVSADGKSLNDNPYSWNKVANIIFLESPAGVGFSYSDDEEYSIDDDTVSEDNYVALQNFFEKFPEFKENDFYIAGESYGGIYVPTLSVRVLSGSADINFKGFAVGNSLLDTRDQFNSIVFFSYFHGLFGKNLWDNLSEHCCGGVAAVERCNFYDSNSTECQNDVSQALNIVLKSDINLYNLYADCDYSLDGDSRYLVEKETIIFKSSKSRDAYKSSGDPACLDYTNIRHWMNQPSVREALHIPSYVQNWTVCSLEVVKGYKRNYVTMRPQILQLIGSGKIRGLIYNGDVDIACNFLSNEWFADDLDLQVTKEYGPWRYNNQIAGFFKSYGPLTFLTVKGAGHMVPQDKPGQALKMFVNFLSNKTYY